MCLSAAWQVGGGTKALLIASNLKFTVWQPAPAKLACWVFTGLRAWETLVRSPGSPAASCGDRAAWTLGLARRTGRA